MSKEYNPFESMTFTNDRCFLCGELLNEENSSDEHIFPKWLQNKFDLWDKEITLLNGSQIKYRMLKIPCCKDCNGEILSTGLEKKIGEAVEGGYDNFIKLEEKVIFQWLLKLSYGMLFKELSLNVNLRNPNEGKIMTPEILKNFNTMYLLLKTVLYDTEFVNKPWSILIFKVKTMNEKMYNGRDFIPLNCYFMRMNDIGIIANLQDGGVQQEFFNEVMREFIGVELEEIQFSEICAKVLYKCSLYKKSPYFTFIMPKELGNKCTVITHPMSGDIFEEWDNREYAEYLVNELIPWGANINDIYINGEVMTYLYNEDGSIKELNYI